MVVLATLLGVVVRVSVAARSEVWLDEAYSVLLALSDFGELFTQLSLDNSPPLYYLILKGWAFFAPLTPFTLRIPSLVFGCALIPAMWYVGSRMDRPLTGVAAAWLLAVHPLHTFYSEEIRMYSLLALLALGFYYSLFGLLRRNGSLLPVLFTAIGLTYTHYYGLVLAGMGLLVALVVLPARRVKIILCGLGIGIAFLPWLSIFLKQIGNPGMVGWMAPFWDSYPGGAAIFRTFQAFLPGGMKYQFMPLEGLPFQPALILIGLLPLLLLALKPDRRELLQPLWLPLGVSVLTLVVLVLRSYISEPIYLVGRSDIVVLPICFLALAMALARISAGPRALFLAAWVVLSGLELLGSAENLRKAGNEELASTLDEAGCTTVIATGLSFAPVAIYELFQEEKALVIPFPIDIATHPGYLRGTSYSVGELERDAEILSREYPPGPGVCVLGGGRTFTGPLAEAYLSGGAPAREIGVFQTSLLAGSNYVLVTFSGS